MLVNTPSCAMFPDSIIVCPPSLTSRLYSYLGVLRSDDVFVPWLVATLNRLAGDGDTRFQHMASGFSNGVRPDYCLVAPSADAADWADVLVVGEHQSAHKTPAGAFIQLANYAAQALAHQPRRVRVHGVLTYSTAAGGMRVYVFDRGGALGSRLLATDAATLAPIAAAYAAMPPAALGLPHQPYATPCAMLGRGSVALPDGRLAHLGLTLCCRPGIARRATYCVEATLDGAAVLVKLSWRSDARVHEGALLALAAERGVVAVARHVAHWDVIDEGWHGYQGGGSIRAGNFPSGHPTHGLHEREQRQQRQQHDHHCHQGHWQQATDRKPHPRQLHLHVYRHVLNWRPEPHAYHHDLESFLYVVLWVCLRGQWGGWDNDTLQWYSGSTEAIVGQKYVQMTQTPRFERILSNFAPQYCAIQGPTTGNVNTASPSPGTSNTTGAGRGGACFKHVARQWREILFRFDYAGYGDSGAWQDQGLAPPPPIYVVEEAVPGTAKRGLSEWDAFIQMRDVLVELVEELVLSQTPIV
ncbi:hypothetical protein DFH27DRAFT_529056 [Peziza echinospora]|nr:hypothetical protein DFH27DRAFT_529056 [Peziza echinospora]